MTVPDPATLTDLLSAAQGGDTRAQDEVARAVYSELRQLADRYLTRERPDHTLQPTALVNEAYLRLIHQTAPWSNRSHFFAVAASMMRRILVDHARRSTAERRDRQLLVPLEHARNSPADPDINDVNDTLGVHEALEQLERVDARQARIVELKFFVGLSLTEIADLLDISPATVSREWAMARTWLHQRLAND